MDLRINPLLMVLTVVVCLLAYHLAYRLAVVLREPTLIYWSLGPLGVTAVSLRKPRASIQVGQYFYGALAMASALYLALFVARPAPIAGLARDSQTALLAVVAPVALVTLVALIAQARARRYSLWGEARVLSAAQRSLALGSALFFTPLGRAFLHDHFNATPSEFIQTIRS